MAGRSKALLHLNYPEGLRGTSLEAKIVYTRLLCDDALNHAGVLPLRVALWADEVELTEGAVDKALRELEDKRYAYTDYKTHQVLVRTLIRNDEIAAIPNILWSACRAALNLRSKKLRRVLASELRKLAPKPPDKISEKTGKRYVYPDPHGTADKIDPGPPDDSEGDAGSHRRSHPASHDIPSDPIPRDAGSPGEGDGEGEEVSVGRYSPSEPRKRGARATRRIPDDWRPGPAHEQQAHELNLDLAYEARQFRGHAESVDRRLKNWDAGFRNWLDKSANDRNRRGGRHLSVASSGGNPDIGFWEQ